MTDNNKEKCRKAYYHTDIEPTLDRLHQVKEIVSNFEIEGADRLMIALKMKHMDFEEIERLAEYISQAREKMDKELVRLHKYEKDFNTIVEVNFKERLEVRIIMLSKWLKEMTWLTTPERKIKWTHDAVIEESHKYEYKCDFRKYACGAHQTASENGWLKEMTWLKDKHKPHNYWTKEKVFEESHKYSNKKDFENKAKTAFLKAMSNGWLPWMTWLKPLPLGKISKWTREAIIEESKKYTSRTEFAINSPTAYQYACEDKTIFKEMPWIKEKKKPMAIGMSKSMCWKKAKNIRIEQNFLKVPLLHGGKQKTMGGLMK